MKLRAWQMFMLIVMPMFLPMVIMPSKIGIELFGWLTAAWCFVLVGWMYSVGSAANRRVPDALRKNEFIYRLGFLVALGYISLVAIVGFPGGVPDPAAATNPPPSTIPAWLVPLHFAAMFGMFYGLWFTAKQFMSLDRGSAVRFYEYSGPFFLFWFAPLGVWFLQPRINALFSEQDGDESPEA